MTIALEFQEVITTFPQMKQLSDITKELELLSGPDHHETATVEFHHPSQGLLAN